MKTLRIIGGALLWVLIWVGGFFAGQLYEARKWAVDVAPSSSPLTTTLVDSNNFLAMGVDTTGDFSVLLTDTRGYLMAKCLTDDEIVALPPLNITRGVTGQLVRTIHTDNLTGVALVKCVEH